jgi:hypothetical protein
VHDARVGAHLDEVATARLLLDVARALGETLEPVAR